MKNLEINTVIIRKNLPFKRFKIVEKKVLNNIPHYILETELSRNFIISERAIRKEFVLENRDSLDVSYLKKLKNTIKNRLKRKK